MALKGWHLPEETKRKLSKSHLESPVAIEQVKRLHEIMASKGWGKGRRLTPEQRERCRLGQIGVQAGEKNGRWGKPVSEETRHKMSVALKGKPSWCKGKHLSEETKRKLSESRKGRFAGENCPRWKGGISYEPYCPKFTKEFKERVRAFFGYNCLECGSPQNGERLHVHHVNFNKQSCCDSTIPLFVPLCRPCHSKTGHNREYWEPYFTQMIEGYYGGKCYFTKEEMIAYSTTSYMD